MPHALKSATVTQWHPRPKHFNTKAWPQSFNHDDRNSMSLRPSEFKCKTTHLSPQPHDYEYTGILQYFYKRYYSCVFLRLRNAKTRLGQGCKNPGRNLIASPPESEPGVLTITRHNVVVIGTQKAIHATFENDYMHRNFTGSTVTAMWRINPYDECPESGQENSRACVSSLDCWKVCVLSLTCS
jgi:hypothetical protein